MQLPIATVLCRRMDGAHMQAECAQLSKISNCRHMDTWNGAPTAPQLFTQSYLPTAPTVIYPSHTLNLQQSQELSPNLMSHSPLPSWDMNIYPKGIGLNTFLAYITEATKMMVTFGYYQTKLIEYWQPSQLYPVTSPLSSEVYKHYNSYIKAMFWA